MNKSIYILIFILLAHPSIASEIDGYYAKHIRTLYTSGARPEHAVGEEGLSVKKKSEKEFLIEAVTRGENGHFCKYKGTALAIGDNLISTEGNCTVTITISNGSASVSSTEGCSVYCGARATLSSSDLRKISKNQDATTRIK